jgi:hypothetical protein
MAKKRRDDDDVQSTSGGSIAVNDAWTGMLAISLLALMIGAGFLAWDYHSHTSVDLPKVPNLSTPKGPGQPAQQEEPKKKDDGKGA